MDEDNKAGGSLLGEESNSSAPDSNSSAPDSNSSAPDSNSSASDSNSSAPDSEITYSEFTIPDDATNVADDKEVMGGFVNLAKELNLTQEQAQKVVEFGAKSMHKAIGDGMEAIRAQVEEIKRKWHKEASDDPVVKADLPFAQRVVNRFRNDDFVGMLNETGVGSHPAMIKFLIEIGKTMGEAPLLTGGLGSGGSSATDIKTVADNIYKDKM